MASNYILIPRTQGRFGVYWREALKHEEIHARMHDLVSSGWNRADALAEINSGLDVLKDCSRGPEGAPLDECMEFIAHYAQNNDTIFILNRLVN